MGKIYNEFMGILGPDAFIKGLNYNSADVKFDNVEDDGFIRTCYFDVHSERTSEVYSVMIEYNYDDEKFLDFDCDCLQFEKVGMCKHVGASLLKYSDEIIYGLDCANSLNEDGISSYQLRASKDILDFFYKPKSNKIRKRLRVQLILHGNNSYYYGSSLWLGFKVGEDRLYSLNNKFANFMNAYDDNEDYKLAVKFTYSPKEHYFASCDEKLFDYISSHNQHEYSGERFSGGEINTILDILSDREFYIENDKGVLYRGVKNENPFKFELIKENDLYVLKFLNINEFSMLVPKFPYVYNNCNFYKVPKKVFDLYSVMVDREIDSIIFEENDLGKFTDGIMPYITNEVKIDETASKVVAGIKPVCKMYFDFYYNAVECKVTLMYGDQSVDINEKSMNITRDSEFEGKIFEKLDEMGFVYDEKTKKFLLDDVDLIGELFENYISQLGEEYEVFTSKKIKDTSIVKNASGSANFSIGKDNIMSYDFKIDGVGDDELIDLLNSLRTHKKYYRLKNGSLLHLSENEDIENISKLANDMDLAGSELLGGEIPKYKAIYYDSLRSGRYGNIIKTNNAFDTLVKRFNSYKDIEITLPDSELLILRDYQKTGVKWLYNIYKSGFGGILADEMGLGKSIQLIYLIKLILKDKHDAKILVVAPTSLVYNWKKEFDRFGSEINYKVFAENKEQRLNSLNLSSSVNVFITTYGLVRNDCEFYNNMFFDLVAIDEAQNIKNASAQMSKIIKGLKSDVKIALTGTPLENSVMELWSIFDFIMPGYLANMKRFKSLYNVSDIDEDSIRKLDNLNLQIGSFILRRKKKDVVKELPDKIENNVYVEMEDKQKKLYVAEVERTKKEMDNLVSTEGFTKARFKILQLITRLRQICIDPNIVFDNYKGRSSKIDELVKIARQTKENGEKMLIFTTYKTALDIAMNELNNAGISSYYIDGSVPSKKRMELVEKFNSDDTDAFLITLKAGGTGLNLTSATTVIHLDLWWNPQVENQATDRAHRIGQKNTVSVIRLISSGTIEERILKLQEKKRKLADALIEGDMRDSNQFSTLTSDDIKNLLAIDNE